MNFKEQLNEDLDVFFNTDEFSETHNINGKDISITPDEDLLKERKAKFAEGTYLGSLLFHVKKEELDFEPIIDKLIKYDKEPKFITDCQENMGVYTITIGENKS